MVLLDLVRVIAVGLVVVVPVVVNHHLDERVLEEVMEVILLRLHVLVARSELVRRRNIDLY